MQKIRESDQARAETVLRSALPEDAQVEHVPNAHDPPTLRISLSDTPAFAITLLPHTTDEPVATYESTPVLVVDNGDPAKRDRLRRRGLNFIDLAGVIHLRASGFFLDRNDLSPAPRRRDRRQLLDPYTDRASRVVRTLLLAPASRRWSIQELADEAQLAASTVSRVIRELRRRELVRDDSPGQGRRSAIWVPGTEGLLEDWARAYDWQDNAQLRVAAPVGSPGRFIGRMPDLFGEVRWALTLQAGASLVAPHATFDVIHAYLETDQPLEIFAQERGWEITPSGKLCLLDPFYRESVWFQSETIEGVPVVSSLQLALDLWRYPVRGRRAGQTPDRDGATTDLGVRA